jgi:transposase-like protein
VSGVKADLPEDEIVRLRVEEKLSLRQIARRYGVSHHPIRRVLAERGLRGRHRWTEEEALEALRAYERETGRQPAHDRWKRERRRPVGRVYVELFGSWGNAMVAAGFDAFIPGDNRPFDERDAFDRESEALQARVDAGATLAELAPEAGVTPQALGRRLARWRRFYGGDHREPPPGARPRRAIVASPAGAPPDRRTD